MSLIDAIKDRVDIVAFVTDDLGKPMEKNRDISVFYCPFHKDDSASFTVYGDPKDPHYHCFGCQRHGDVVTYVQERLGIGTKEAVHFLKEKLNITDFAARPERMVEKEPPKKVELSMQEQVERHAKVDLVRPYLYSRGITDAIIDQNLIGATKFSNVYVDTTGRRWNFQCNRVALPYILGDKVYSLNFRRDDLSAMEYLNRMSVHHNMDMFEFLRIDIAEKENKDPASIKREKVMRFAFGTRFYRPATPITVYGVHNLVHWEGDKLVYEPRPYVAVTEGEFNQISAEIDRFWCIAAKQIAGVNLPSLCRNVRMVLVVTDPGEGGRLYADKVFEAFNWDNTIVREAEMPHGFNDMNEMKQQEILAEYLSGPPYYLDQF